VEASTFDIRVSLDRLGLTVSIPDYRTVRNGRLRWIFERGMWSDGYTAEGGLRSANPPYDCYGKSTVNCRSVLPAFTKWR